MTREQLIHEARKALECVFLAADAGPAQDIHNKGRAAIDFLDKENAALRQRVMELEQQLDAHNITHKQVGW
jgi:hypothetical protein